MLQYFYTPRGGNGRGFALKEAFFERNHGDYAAGQGQNAVQYFYRRTLLLRPDAGGGGEKPTEGGTDDRPRAAFGNSAGERKGHRAGQGAYPYFRFAENRKANRGIPLQKGIPARRIRVCVEKNAGIRLSRRRRVRGKLRGVGRQAQGRAADSHGAEKQGRSGRAYRSRGRKSRGRGGNGEKTA